MADFDVNITDEDRDTLARIVATEADHRYATSDPDTYNAMVAGIVDTVLNRVASPSFPSTIEAVANQKNQFSAINGPRGRGYEVYGSVRNVPDSIVTDTVRKAVDNWVDQRILGTPSSVGGGLHYANPNFSDESNLDWIEALTGPRVGAGVSLHYHGTAPGYRPKEGTVTGLVKSANSQFVYEDGLGLTTSSGKFLGLAPLLNQKTPGSNVTRSIIGDIPVVVKAKPGQSQIERNAPAKQTQTKTNQPLPAPKPLSFPAILPNLVTRQVKTVQIDPRTGMPYKLAQKPGQSTIERSAPPTPKKASVVSPTVPARRPDTPTIGSTIGGVNTLYKTIIEMTAPLRPKTGLQPVKGVSSAVPQPGTTYENLVKEYRLFGGTPPQKPGQSQIERAPAKKTGFQTVPGQSQIERTRATPKGSPGIVIARPAYDTPFERGNVTAPRVPARRPDTVRSPTVPARRPSYSPVTISVSGGQPAPQPAAPSYQTTQFQQDRFQTTSGSQMPSATNNSRWTTGY